MASPKGVSRIFALLCSCVKPTECPTLLFIDVKRDWSDLERGRNRHLEVVYDLYGLQLEFQRREKDIKSTASSMTVMARIWHIVRS